MEFHSMDFGLTEVFGTAAGLRETTGDPILPDYDFHHDFSSVPLFCKEAITFSSTSGPF